jgi:hypothetical protein
MRDFLLAYGWLSLPLSAAIALFIFLARRRALRARAEQRSQRRRRNIAHQRAWDWVMGRPRLRIPHMPDE